MRNIALLEWGPASLYYVLPRERIKVRTAWLDGGPVMPAFLSTLEEVTTPDLGVRYALSAFEDLNSAIKNLRRCFGFPYQEYIGYLNALKRSHRARREHEYLIDRLRRWAVYGNVDAILWIDYAKANQPAGSFKMGPIASRPFSERHMEICTNGLLSGAGYDSNDGEDSEVVWTEPEDDQGTHGVHGVHGVLGIHGHSNPGVQPSAVEAIPRSDAAGFPRRLHGSRRGGIPLRRIRGSSAPPAGSKLSLAAAGVAAAQQRSARGGPPRENSDPARGHAAKEENGAQQGSSQLKDATSKDKDRTLLRSMIQEEVIPAHGSIYKRTITPGPGYYANEGADCWQVGGVTLGGRARGRIDEVSSMAKELPGPGEYTPKAPVEDVQPHLGRFNRAEKLVLPVDIPRKLPFVSVVASRCEVFGVHSPAGFHSVTPGHMNGGSEQAPRYSFGKARRPF